MTAPDELSFERAAARIGHIMTVVGVLGTCGALALGGWKTGGGFLLGALISGLNYRWLHKLVESLGSGGTPRNRSVAGSQARVAKRLQAPASANKATIFAIRKFGGQSPIGRGITVNRQH